MQLERPAFYEFLHARGVGFCNIDQPVIVRSLKPSERTTASTGYMRLHGRRYDTWFSDDPETPAFDGTTIFTPQAELEPWVARNQARGGLFHPLKSGYLAAVQSSSLSETMSPDYLSPSCPT